MMYCSNNRISIVGCFFIALLLFCNGCSEESSVSNAGTESLATQTFDIVSSPTSFELLDPSSVGILANNSLTETEGFNHFLWASIYNGSGVGIGDFDGNGLPDIYMGQNMRKDKLYLNKGNMKFEDASDNLPDDNRWTSGVAVVDINNDGKLDVYVSKFGPSKNPEDRRNQMLVNQGDAVFKDEAKQYGLDDSGYTTQVAFFDVDKDGDKDVYVVNQPPDSRFRQNMTISDEDKKQFYSDRLYIRNASGRYVDRTEKYGLINYAPGLNVLVNDINEDGWLDLYVSNDYEQPDFIYINQGGKSYKDELTGRTGHISNFSMGSDVADINNDGLNDIAVLDMSSSDHYRSKTNMGAMNEDAFWQNVAKGNHFQYMFNTLQLNQGKGKFSEIGQMAGVAQTDWSWSVLIEDFNMDGLKDMYVTNGIKKDIRNNDFLNIIEEGIKSGQNSFKIKELLPKIPSNPISNYYFENNGDLTFANNTASSGMEHPDFSTGAGIADFDRDGDLDVIASVSEGPSKLFSNTTSYKGKYIRYDISPELWNEFLNAKFIVETSQGNQRKDVVPTRGYLSSAMDGIIFGIPASASISGAYVETIYGDTYNLPIESNESHTIKKEGLKKSSTKSKNAMNTYFAGTAGLDYTHVENEYNDFKKEILLPHKLSENGPCAVSTDIDGDGDDDVIVGGSLGNSLKMYENKGGSWTLMNADFWKQYAGNENQDIIPFDVDGDNDLDLYIVNGGNESSTSNQWLTDQLFINDGKGNYSLDENLASIGRNTSTAVAMDFDEDGDSDVFVFGSNIIGSYPKAYESYLLENVEGKLVLNKEKSTFLDGLGMVSDAVKIDYDADSKEDIFVVGPWEYPKVITASKSKILVDSPLETEALSSWWTHVSKVDLDNDGKDDLVLGSFGDNNKFHPSKKKPLEIYGSDFDGSGSNDVVLAKHYNNKVVPTRGRECSSQQIPNIQEKFPTYNEFALAGIEEILGEEKIENAVHKKINTMSHYVLWNSDGGWEADKLPSGTQISPLKSTASLDVNKDGIKDIIGIGNHFGAEVETARYDAGYGWVVLGSSSRKLSFVPPLSSGIDFSGDGRSLLSVKNGTETQILAFINNGKTKSYKLR